MPDPKIIQFPLGLTENLQYHYTKVVVSSAEILALNSVPKTLVAAPGAGYLLMPIGIVIDYDYGTITYATNTDLALTNDSGDEIRKVDNVLTQVADFTSMGVVPLFPATGRKNESLKLRVNTGDPTAGNGSLTVYLWYINLEL